MSSVRQRRKKLRVGGIWHDAQDNKVEIIKIKYGKVTFRILELTEHIPTKQPDGRVQLMPMEDRTDTLPVETFIASPTGFDCMSETGRVRNKLW